MRPLAWPPALLLLLAEAVPAGAAEVVILRSGEQPGFRVVVDTLRRSTANHTLSEFDMGGNRAQGERIASGLRGRAAIVVAMGVLAAQVARAALPEAPLVFCMVPDPGEIGLLQVPRVAGVAAVVPVKNQLAAFRLVNPRGVRIGVLAGAESGPAIEEAQRAARLVRVALSPRLVASDKDVPPAVRELLTGSEAVDAVWILPDPVLMEEQTRKYVLAEALKVGRPVYASSEALIVEGALASDGPDPVSVGEQVAELVNRLAAGELGPVEMRVPRAELIINRKVAAKLKIDVPADALRAASRIF